MAGDIRATILGEIKPYTRVGRERWTKRATDYLASRDRIRAELLAQVGYVPPELRVGPWELDVVAWRYKLRGDADNLLKAVADAAEGVLWDDDSTVVAMRVRREFCRRGEDRIELVATPLPVGRMPARWIKARRKEGVLT